MVCAAVGYVSFVALIERATAYMDLTKIKLSWQLIV
jgi:hypothetical protein